MSSIEKSMLNSIGLRVSSVKRIDIRRLLVERLLLFCFIDAESPSNENWAIKGDFLLSNPVNSYLISNRLRLNLALPRNSIGVFFLRDNFIFLAIEESNKLAIVKPRDGKPNCGVFTRS